MLAFHNLADSADLGAGGAASQVVAARAGKSSGELRESRKGECVWASASLVQLVFLLG